MTSASSRARRVMTSVIAAGVYAGAARRFSSAATRGLGPRNGVDSERAPTPRRRRQPHPRWRASGRRASARRPASRNAPSSPRRRRKASRSAGVDRKRSVRQTALELLVAHDVVVEQLLEPPSCEARRRDEPGARPRARPGCGPSRPAAFRASCATERNEKCSTSIGMPAAQRLQAGAGRVVVAGFDLDFGIGSMSDLLVRVVDRPLVARERRRAQPHGHPLGEERGSRRGAGGSVASTRATTP